ncbi:unnamed protein product [Bursaphelenchus xylophilus]|uniref:(pine wood nematode) hypothetical protein n=1 Tax=Bursaphelenchus xylophilus TaxID=6326 RepID=A0A1I7S1V1_BURXY|nr:unnamed protein product [Bursaphelenchus xylophilus]CAG9089983.1 unnamed protein product [Bursaphelenchus xylophilus]
MADVYGVGYGALVTLGGVIGFLKAGSWPSFIAGAGFGLAAVYGGLNHNFEILAGVSGLLSILMGLRFYNSGKVMPAGLVASLSIIMFIRTVLVLSSRR